MRIFSIVTLLVVSLFSFDCMAGTIRPDTPDQKYLDYGAQFKCVYRIAGTYANRPETFVGSCVVINEHFVLTAAHVVENADFVTIMGDDGKIHIIEEIVIHKDFNKEKLGGYDIALCYCSTSIELGYYPPLYKENNEVGRISCMSGYGFTGDFNNGVAVDEYDGKKRAGANFIDKIQYGMLICSASEKKRTALEYLICSGDSGGGLFIDKKLAGINSCVMASDGKPDSGYGDESGHTRISAHYDWIVRNIEEVRENK